MLAGDGALNGFDVRLELAPLSGRCLGLGRGLRLRFLLGWGCPRRWISALGFADHLYETTFLQVRSSWRLRLRVSY
jgi:hypothetical protein